MNQYSSHQSTLESQEDIEEYGSMMVNFLSSIVCFLEIVAEAAKYYDSAILNSVSMR